METQKKGRVVPTKEVIGVGTLFFIAIAGFVGAGQLLLKSINIQAGLICGGIGVLATLLLAVGYPLYMSRKGKKGDK